MALAVLSLVALGVAVALLAALHAVPSRLSPVADAVSDYGTTRFHPLYRAMVVALGVAAAALALDLGRHTDAGNVGWLWAFAAARVAIAGFMTDRDPPPFTAEGRVHWLLAAVAFTSIAVAASSIDWTGQPGVLGALGEIVAVAAVATLLTRLSPRGRRVFGLVERVLYVTSVAWLAIAAGSLAG